MHKVLLSLLSAFALAAPAQASLINIEYTARLSGISVRDVLDDGNVNIHAEQSVNIGGSAINYGEKITGYLTYDTDTPYFSPGYGTDPDTAIYQGNGPGNRMRLQFDGGFAFSALPGQGVSFGIFNNAAYTYGEDAWMAWANNGPWDWASLTMFDPSGNMFNDASLARPSFELARSAFLNVGHADPVSGQIIYLVAGLDSFQQVPEPATLATVAAGLGLLAVTRRRKAAGKR